MTSQVHFRMSEKEKKDFEIVLSRVHSSQGKLFVSLPRNPLKPEEFPLRSLSQTHV